MEYHAQHCKDNNGCSLCMIPRVSRFTLRGLSPDANVDTLYYMDSYIADPNTTDVMFTGYTWNQIRWNIGDMKMWIYDHQHVTAVMKVTSNPVGRFENVTVRLMRERNNVTQQTLKLSRVS